MQNSLQQENNERWNREQAQRLRAEAERARQSGQDWAAALADQMDQHARDCDKMAEA